MKPEDYLYALPLEYYEKYAVRRYGAHGTSHHYLADEAIEKYLMVISQRESLLFTLVQALLYVLLKTESASQHQWV